MKTKKVANTGDFFSRIEENVKNGWKYPKRLVVSASSGGRWGNIYHYYLFNGKKFDFIATIPTWGSSKEGTKYSLSFHRVEKIRKKYGESSLQGFVTERK